MTVSDPLIKDLKGWTRKLMENGHEIEDGNSDLISFCSTLEKCFQQGLITKMSSIGFPKNLETWTWMKDIGEYRKTFMLSFNLAIEHVSSNLKVQTDLGRLRLLIRFCLTKNCIHIPVQLLVRTPGLSRDYYERNSILGDEILGEILLSVLLQIDRLNFKLNLRNASFLDDSWLLPEYCTSEFVPCKILGISVCFIREKALVVSVQENSVAAEDDKVEVGDVIDEINGEIVTAGNKGKLSRIMKKSSGIPIKLHIVKFRSKSSNNMYGPLVNLVQLTGIERLKKILKPTEIPIQTVTNSLEETKTDEIKSVTKRNETSSTHAGYRVTYCGFISTGTEGDVKQIEQATCRLLKSGSAKSTWVRFECLEISIKVTRESDDTVILKPNYMEISSCGRTANIPNYFAFIVGDTTCNMATKFDAHIFNHQNENEVQTILQSLGQGFHRTHFAV